MRTFIFTILFLTAYTALCQPWYSKIIDPFNGKHESATIIRWDNDTMLIRASTICSLDVNTQCSIIGKYNVSDNEISSIQKFENIQTGRKGLVTHNNKLFLSSEESPAFDRITLSRVHKSTLQHDTSLDLKIPDDRYYNYTIKRSIKYNNKFFIGCQALDSQTYIPYLGWYKDQESAVFFVLDENLQTDTVLILPPSSGAHLRIEDLAVGPDSILYVSFLEKYLKSDVPNPYLEIRKVLYGFDKNYNKVFEWTGPNLDIQESWTCLAIGPDSTIYMNHKHDYRTYLMAMKPDGSVKWECLLDSTIGFNLYDIRRLIVADNGDIVGAGTISSVIDELGVSGFVFRVDSNGHLKWKRAIRVNKGFDLIVPLIFPYETGLEDLTELPNGDLIAVGYVRKYVGNTLPDGPYNFDMWIVRTSSEGCLWDDCQYIQDIVTKNDYIPVVTPLNEWVVDYIHPVPGWPAEKIRRYTFAADSVLLEGKYYHELIYSKDMSGGPWTLSGTFLREENGVVFIKSDNLPEKLLYNFHFGISDSITGNPNVNQATRYVTQVGSTQLFDGTPRKSILLNSICGESQWVEGIGELEALFYSESYCSLWDGNPLFIRCFSTNGQLLYARPGLSDCYISSVQDLLPGKVRVFPNPGAERLYFETENEATITSLQLFNSVGSLVFSTTTPLLPRDGLDVSGLPPGFYSGLLYLENQEVKVFKVVLER